MLEIIIEFIVYIVVQIIFEGIILGFIRMVKKLGLFILKLITFSGKSMKEIEEAYPASSKPYFLGFGIIILVIYFIVKMLF